MKLIVPNIRYLNENLDGLMWHISKLQANDNFSFDFSNIEFLRPESTLLLILLSFQGNAKTKQPVEWIGLSHELYSYMERIDIATIPFIFPKPPLKSIHWKRSKSPSDTLIEIRTIRNVQECASVVARTKNVLSKWFPEKIATNYLQEIPILISEIIGNSLEHSDFPANVMCYYTLQKYHYKESPKVVIALGDIGMGIRNSLKSSNSWIKENDYLAIKKAFFEGVSSRSDGTGGLGFQSVKEILKKHNGSITIRSGMAALSYDIKSNKDYKKDFRIPLPGTQTSFIL